MKKKRISPLFLLILIIVALIHGIYLLSDAMAGELSELGVPLSKCEVVYRSERGFGNDRFDVYSFALENKDADAGFQVYDDEANNKYFRIFEYFLDSEDHQELKKVKNDIENLKHKKNCVYKFSKNKGTRKMYLYDREMNQGYCLILTI